MNFGSFIALKRKKLNHKRIYIANKLDLSATYIRDVENGNRPAPNPEILSRLLANLNIDKGTDDYITALNLASETRNDIPLDIKEFLIKHKDIYYPKFRKLIEEENWD